MTNSSHSNPSHNIQDRKLLDIIGLANAFHFTDDAMQMRGRIEAVCPESVLSQQMISVAPVKFDRRWFDINADAKIFALIVPVRNEDGALEDAAAFELSPPFRVKLLFGSGIAIGLSEIFEARHHPQFRVMCHTNIWAYLRSECSGLLPVNWRQTILHLHKRGIGGMIAVTVDEGKEISRLMSKALPPIPVYVQASQEAA